MSTPIPVPTPYQSVVYGGNPYLVPGTTGQALGASAYPTSTSGGSTLFNSGVSYPSSRVVGGGFATIVNPKVQGASTVATPTDSSQVNPSSQLSDLQKAAQDRSNPSKEAEYQRLLRESQLQSQPQQQPTAPSFDASGYTSQLDQMLEGLGGQRTALEGVAQSQQQQGITAADLAKQQNVDILGNQRTTATENQAKSLKDVDTYLRNAFQAGNMYLGARGAGDSSAGNMLSYALTKLGGQQRGDIMSQTSDILKEINGRETGIQQIYDSEKKRLQSVYEGAIQNVTSWWEGAKQQIGGMKADAALQNSKAAYDYAISQVNAAQANKFNQQSMLDAWAANNSTTLQQLKTNLSAVSGQGLPNMPSATPFANLQSDAQGNVTTGAQIGYGGAPTTEKQSLFGPASYNNKIASQTGGPLLNW